MHITDLYLLFAGSETTKIRHRGRAVRNGRSISVPRQSLSTIVSAGLNRNLPLGRTSQGEDLQGKRMGGASAEAHLFRYVGNAFFPSSFFAPSKKNVCTRGTGPAADLMLLSIGKILQDDKTVETYNIEEKGFIVCMVSKVCFPPGFPRCFPAEDRN